MLPSARRLRSVLPLLVLGSPALAQSTQVWIDHYEPNPIYTDAYGSEVLPFPGGGVISASIGTRGGDSSPGQAVIRRLSENGDIVWEFTRALDTQDYIGLYGREYIAGLDVGPSGEVAIAFGSAGPMEIRLYEPDGTLRWQRTVSVMFGPHFEGSTIGVAAGGDVLFASTENLYLGGHVDQFGLYRFAAADGQQLWWRGAPSNGIAMMALDPQGDAILAVNRDSTGVRNWTVERYDAFGGIVGSASFDMDWNLGGFTDIAVHDSGRTVVSIRGALNNSVASLSPSMALEWSTPLPATNSGTISTMTDGDTVLTGVGLNWDLIRFDGATGAAHFAPANVVGNHLFSAAVGLPNGNCVVAIAKWDVPDGLCIEERDPAGAVVRTHTPPTDWRHGVNDLALGERGNVYIAYWLYDQHAPDRGGLAKVVFDDEQGAPYCGPAVPNSTGRSATVRAVGSTGAAINNLSLLFADLPPGTTVLPIASQTTGLVMQPGGSQGTLCLGGSIGRFDEPGEIRFADAAGLASLQVELLRMPTPGGLVPAVAGETWNFQAWYRDLVPPQVSTSNFTDAVSIVLD